MNNQKIIRVDVGKMTPREAEELSCKFLGIKPEPRWVRVAECVAVFLSLASVGLIPLIDRIAHHSRLSSLGPTD
jgi:hypothetical protein